MGYRFREVKCPYCEHVFMWGNLSEGLVRRHEYKSKETGELLEQTRCPKCDIEMVILEHVLEGVDSDDERIVHSGWSWE